MRPFFASCLLLADAAFAEPGVLLSAAVGNPRAVATLSGRVLKNAPSAGSSKLAKNLRALTASTWEGATVEVRFAGRTATVTSGHDGDFLVTLAPDDGKLFPVGIENAEAQVKGVPPAVATVDIIATEAPFFLVSDLDDTLSVTKVLDKAALLDSALLKDETTQPAVEGMAEFYGCLRDDKKARPGFALVSGSPIQYLGRVTRFLSRNRFPVMGVYLRELGPGTLSDYKQPVIRALMKSLPNPVVLVGDSGEHDPEVYAQMRAEFPGRVQAIYIRNAGHADDLTRFSGMLLFSDPHAAADDAVKRGLATRECVERSFIKPDAGSLR